MYNYSGATAGGMYPTSSSPAQQQQHYYPGQQPYSNQRAPYQQPPPEHQQARSSHMANGSQSPVKNPSKPSNSPPGHDYHRQPQPPIQQHPSQGISRSPSANFPPPAPSTYPAQGYAQSPVKSSSPPNQYYQQQAQYYQRPAQPAPQLAPSPQSARLPSVNGVHPNHNYNTPHQPHQSPAPASANANGIAADGMSGPWPERSRAIPQKKKTDQHSPPPPPIQVGQSPHTFQPSSAGNALPTVQTSQPARNTPASTAANANGVAVDGMSGPWPEGSRAIPQKSDPSPAPAPPASGQVLGEAKIVPSPTAAPPKLAPSPPSLRMQSRDAVSEVPVKKMQDIEPPAQESAVVAEDVAAKAPHTDRTATQSTLQSHADATTVTSEVEHSVNTGSAQSVQSVQEQTQ